MASINIRHVDTCLPCYVLDHCNGERETLLGVAVTSESTYASVKRDLIAEWNGADLYGKADVPDDSAVLAEIESEFSGAPDMAAPFTPSLEPSEDDDEPGESVSAWFRIEWEAPEGA